MASKNVFILLVLIACLLANETGARDLPIKPGYKTASTFQIDGAQATCLHLLMGMNYCTSEIVDFFSGSQSNIGSGCCRSISSISKNCWPSTLTSFGFTADVHNKLKDHCAAASSPAEAPAAVLAEAPSPISGSDDRFAY